jgi:hypothetical protein
MRMRVLTTALLTCLVAAPALAQNEVDALRYMTNGLSGTARSIGAGGAFSAVGADFSATTLNPAGLGLYRRSDLMFTPRILFAGSEANYIGTQQSDSKSKFGFANIGYVANTRISKWNPETLAREEAQKGIKSYAISIGFNQVANFTRQTSISAYNTESSIADYFAGLASGRSINTVYAETGLAGAALNAGLIDTSLTDVNYVAGPLGGQVQQDIVLLESGRTNEWSIGTAANIDDRIFIGATVGIQDLKYTQELYHDESDVNNVHRSYANDSTPFAALSYTNIFDTRGTGINLKLGVIFRPNDLLRVGISFASPTYIAMTDDYVYEITGNFDQNPTDYGLSEQSGTFTYSFTTPYRVTAGAVLLLQKKGFLSADVEYLDYTGASYNKRGVGNTYNFIAENQSMRTLFGSAVNVRLGGELRFGQGRARLGYARNGQILNAENRNYIDYETGGTESLPGARHIFTGGLGIKQETFYLDIAYAQELSADRRLYYTVQDPTAYSPELIRKLTTGNFYMTIGFTF